MEKFYKPVKELVGKAALVSQRSMAGTWKPPAFVRTGSGASGVTTEPRSSPLPSNGNPFFFY